MYLIVCELNSIWYYNNYIFIKNNKVYQSSDEFDNI